MTRIAYRVSCSKCGAIYNLRVLKPKKAGVCDKCGGKLVQRSDETPEAVKERLRIYKERTAPLEEYYRKKGLLISVYNEKADIDPQIMVDRILAKLKEVGKLKENKE